MAGEARIVKNREKEVSLVFRRRVLWKAGPDRKSSALTLLALIHPSVQKKYGILGSWQGSAHGLATTRLRP